MDQWVNDFDHWEITDQCCINLFRKTQFAHDKIYQWTMEEKEFVKRSGFSLIAVLAVHDKKKSDETFIELMELIERESTDDRKMVKKSVNWALRLGKRNLKLNKIAMKKLKK